MWVTCLSMSRCCHCQHSPTCSSNRPGVCTVPARNALLRRHHRMEVSRYQWHAIDARRFEFSHACLMSIDEFSATEPHLPVGMLSLFDRIRIGAVSPARAPLAGWEKCGASQGSCYRERCCRNHFESCLLLGCISGHIPNSTSPNQHDQGSALPLSPAMLAHILGASQARGALLPMYRDGYGVGRQRRSKRRLLQGEDLLHKLCVCLNDSPFLAGMLKGGVDAQCMIPAQCPNRRMYDGMCRPAPSVRSWFTRGVASLGHCALRLFMDEGPRLLLRPCALHQGALTGAWPLLHRLAI